jgi:hypothetical protein
MKTYSDWTESGKSFDGFVQPMDEVDSQMVQFFRTVATPTTLMGDLLQCGEATSVVKGKVLYPTFVKIADKWHFKGNCPRVLWSMKVPDEVPA